MVGDFTFLPFLLSFIFVFSNRNNRLLYSPSGAKFDFHNPSLIPQSLSVIPFDWISTISLSNSITEG